jgi:hypothetical protein
MTPFDAPEIPGRINTHRRTWLAPTLLSLLVSLAIVAPFFWLGNATGHDFQYHAASWLDAAGQWKQGVLYPRWTEWANYGFGEPRFIFYPPFSWMLGAALGLIAPWNGVPVIFIVLVQTLAGVSAFALARRLLENRAAALFCCACYVANPYALLIVYWRSDFAELLADAFLPLLFLSTLRLCGLLKDTSGIAERHTYRRIAAFAVVFAVVWLCNAPAGVIASYSVAVLLAFAALSQKTWLPLTRGAAGLLLAFGITSAYLLPAAYEQRWVNIAQALSTGLLPSENFLYTETRDPEHTLFNWIASTLAVLMIVLAGLAALAARRRNSQRSNGVEETLWRILLLLSAVATLLMLRISSPLWTVLPKLRFVQFPWRWMSLLAIPFAIYLGSAMARGRLRWVWIFVTFALLGGAATGLVKSAWWDTDDIPVLREAIARGQGFEGTDEYDPVGDDHSNIPTKSPEVQVMDTDTTQAPNQKPTVRVERWSPQEKDVAISAPQPFYLGLRLLNYPAWRVQLNGGVVAPRGGEDYNMMVVPVPAGESHVSVRFVRTWDRTLGAILTVMSLIVALWLARKQS